jgi:hypothetical protein
MELPEDELANKLRSPLIQKVYVECWQTPEACEDFFFKKMSGVEQKGTLLHNG